MNDDAASQHRIAIGCNVPDANNAETLWRMARLDVTPNNIKGFDTSFFVRMWNKQFAGSVISPVS